MIYVVKTSFDVPIDDVLSVVYYLLTSPKSPRPPSYAAPGGVPLPNPRHFIS